MKNQIEWEKCYSSKTLRNKNQYPYPEVVSYVRKHYGSVRNKSDIKILELGCGWGNNLRFFRDDGFDYYGIDFSVTAVRHCRKYFKNVVVGDISSLPYKDGMFDCVIDRMAIQHNAKDKIEKIFGEVMRVLKRGGGFLSFLVAREDYGFITTSLTRAEVKKLARPFRGGYKIGYLEFCEDINLQDKTRCHILTAKK